MDLTNNQVYNIFLCDDNIEHLHSLSHTIDGITLGKKIKEISSDIRLVFVTAFAEYAKAKKIL